MLQDFLTAGVFSFLLTFVRVGAAVTIMPGLGDTFTPARIRLFIALGLSLVLSPFIAPALPSPLPDAGPLAAMIGMEFVVGLFLGTVARVLMTALDTAGMLISIQSGLGSAQLFNPALAAQGSLIGAFLSIAGVMVLFSSGLYKLLIYGIVGSYELFPVGTVPDAWSMLELMSRSVSAAFLIGVEIAAPFIVVTMLVYIGMAVLARLMPQIQVFMVALPVQILLSLLTLAMTVSAGMLFWLARFQDGMTYFLGGG